MNHQSFQDNTLFLLIIYNYTFYAARHDCLFPP